MTAPVLRGNVRLAPRSAPVEQPAADEQTGWSVHDGHDAVVLSGLRSRSEAIRQLGALALKGAELPLRVHRPDGSPTGERLA
ncbi:MAG: hypothetical protein ACXVGH_03240 [Mycobacteriales bacterium]